MAVFGVRDRVAHRLHEAVDQRGRKRRASRRLNAPGRDEAGAQGLGKTLLPQRTLRRRFGLRQCTRHAHVHGLGVALVALGVLFDQHLGADVLRRQVLQGVQRWFFDLAHGVSW
jgi:hypothetical protein